MNTREQRGADEATAQTEGRFNRFTADAARLQHVTDRFSVYGRAAGQVADSNLDSSEGFGLGGANGVRAYPQGEAYGDEGWLAQLELRYRLSGVVEPYAFYDAGRIRFNHSPWEDGDNNRTLTGAGTGMRINVGNFSADASAAWSLVGGDPRSDTRDETPRIWLQLQYRM